jgi:hypothetical protein
MSTRDTRGDIQCLFNAAAFLVLSASVGLLTAPTRAQAECCLREVYAAPFTLPAQAKQDWKKFFPSGISSPLHRKLAWSDCPPIEVWLTGKTKDHDYRFVGEVTTQGFTQIDHEGNLRGTFFATVRLMDPDHGDAVLRQAKPVSWTGTITEGLAHKVYTYEPSTDSLNVSWDDKTAELGKQFMDIDELIYDYERKPQSCNVTLPEGSNDAVAAGEIATITLTEISDHKKRPTNYWQRVLVKVEKGKILNAEEKWGALYVFRAGKEARVEVRYQAPDDCSIKTENLTVFNTCMKREGLAGDEKYQIATKTFDVACDRWELEIAYHEQVTHNKRDVQTTSGGTATVENHITGSLDYTITATLKPAPQQPADALRPYRDTEEGLKELLAQPRPTNVPGATEKQTKEIEREEARMKTRAAEVAGAKGIRYYVVRGVQALIKDDFIHTETKTFVSKNARIEDDRRWEWHADKRGPIPLNIRLKTYANENSYHLTLTDHDPMDTGNPQARHSFTIPWNYSARKTLNGQTQLACAGTADVESDDNFPHNVFVHVPDGLLAYDGSQRELRGEHTWTDSHSELDVYRTETPGCKERRALHGSGVLPKNSVQKTLTWTLRKLGK